MGPVILLRGERRANEVVLPIRIAGHVRLRKVFDDVARYGADHASRDLVVRKGCAREGAVALCHRGERIADLVACAEIEQGGKVALALGIRRHRAGKLLERAQRLPS